MKNLAVGMCLIASLGCGTDSTDPAATLDGTYDLKTVNGASLPYVTFENSTEKDEVVGDVMIVNAGEYTQFTANRVTINGRTTDGMSPSSGTYHISGTQVTFSYPGGSFSGTISGDSFTVQFTVPTGGAGLYVRR